MHHSSRSTIGSTVLACLLAGLAAGNTTELVSRSESGDPGNAPSSAPRVSADGRWTVFVSAASNLVPNDTNGVADVFVADRLAGTLRRVSVDANGAQLVRASSHPAISGDGRFVAFDCAQDGIVPFDSNGNDDVYVHELATGVIELASIAHFGGASNGDAVRASLSFDGSIVVFESQGTDLRVAGSNGAVQVWLRDRALGATQLVSVDASGQPSTTSRFGCVSADGTSVVFGSADGALVAGDTNRAIDVFVRDLVAGATERVSVSSTLVQGDGACQLDASISATGRFVAFASSSTNLVAGDTNGATDVFLRDRALGTIARVSVAGASTPANGVSFAPVVSADGAFVLFTSTATNLLGGDTTSDSDVYLRDVANATLELVSRTPAGLAGDGPSGVASMSSDARAVAFQSAASNLAGVDDNGVIDVYGVDRGGGSFPSFCVGDGLLCPCGNDGGGTGGCAHSFGTGGLLRGFGTASVTADSLVLYATSLPPSTTVLFFQGNAQAGLGLGTVFGDGILCAGGTQKRLGARTALSGSAALGAPVAGTSVISVEGVVPPSGGTRYYQAWYRNSADFCTSAVFNFTNAIQVDWQP